MAIKRSRTVHAFLVVSAATALSSCGQKHEASRRCVDENGSFAEDRNCASATSTGAHHYAWVYAPVGASNKSAEESESTGSRPEAGAGTTERGVVGASGEAHTGGGGAAGEGAGE